MHESLRSSEPERRLIASRVLEDPAAWHAWEGEHSNMMRSVAGRSRPIEQVRELRVASFGLIHRKAPFAFLRASGARGESRRRLLRHLRPGSSYGRALLREHTVFLRSAASYLCASHAGRVIALDYVFEDPIFRYEELYTEYFTTYCDVSIAADDDQEVASKRALLPLLKAQLAEQRRVLLDLPPEGPSVLPDAAWRRRTGDTQPLRILGFLSRKKDR